MPASRSQVTEEEPEFCDTSKRIVLHPAALDELLAKELPSIADSIAAALAALEQPAGYPSTPSTSMPEPSQMHVAERAEFVSMRNHHSRLTHTGLADLLHPKKFHHPGKCR